MTTRSFVWLSIGGGAWSLGSNWNDLTDGVDPSSLAPGASDSVMVGGPSGNAMQTITGPGMAAAALFTGNTLLSGRFGIGALTLGQAAAGSVTGGLLELAAATAISGNTANIVAGSLLVGSGATFATTGAASLGDAVSGSAASLQLTNGGMASVASLFLASANASIYVDPNSVLEVGGSTPANETKGALTVDAGGTLTGQGNANAYGAIVDNGTIVASGGTLTLGALSGNGTLQIGAGATLELNARCGAGQSVAFTGANATLALAAEYDAPSGTLTGFAAGDTIDVLGSQISLATFNATSAAGGVLNLYYGTQLAAQLQLTGNYAGDVFLTAGDGAGGTLVSVTAGSGTNPKPSPGTSTPDQYAWTGGTSGHWTVAVNWSDTTRNQTPAGIPPGINNLVTIAAGAGAFTFISGPANAAALAVTGELALDGTFMLGTLTVGQASGQVLGTLDLVAGTTIAATSVLVADGAISAAGSATTLTVSGTLALGGGPSGVGLPTAALSANAGATIQAANLVLGGGSGDSIVADPASIVEIGTAGGAAAGAVTIDAGATLSGNGTVNPFGRIVDNGLVLAQGGLLAIGSVSGAGSLAVAAGATLELMGPTGCGIALQGSATTPGSVLALANARSAPSGTITGFTLGDAIDLLGSPITNTSFTPSTGVLSLLYGTSVVARLTLAGSFSQDKFVLAPDGANGTLISVVNATGGGGSTGQTGTDTLAWTMPVSGGWSRLGNWTDVTRSAPASLPPGAQNVVQIAGASGDAYVDISGLGTCASLAESGNTLFTGTYSTGTLTLAAGASMVVGAATSFLATSANVTSASLLAEGAGAVLSVGGTLTETGAGAWVGALGGGGVLATALSLAGGTLTVDTASWADIGATSSTAAGALTIDAGAQASGFGVLNLAGTIVDGGLVTAQGGTLWLGAASGPGTLAIGTEAVLALTGADTAAIQFAGGGATLLLENTAFPAAPITGFVAGDAIVVATAPIDAVSWQAGGQGLGTLALSVQGQAVGQLMLAGDYTGQSFSVQPNGVGAQIVVSAPAMAGPSPGTVAPDSYTWIGGHGASWSNALNWADTTQNQLPAVVAPGLNDTVWIAGNTGSALQVAGPANASVLGITGTVSLAGTFAAGQLSVGNGAAAGVLSLASGANIAAGSASVAGGIALSGGTLSVAGSIDLGNSARPGVLLASGAAFVQAASINLDGPADVLATGGNGEIDIGGAPQGEIAGTLLVDASGTLSGAGTVQLLGSTLDQGTILASGGLLTLGTVSGAGSLVVGLDASLALAGSVASGMVVAFSGSGTLQLSSSALASPPALAGFAPGDAVQLAGIAATTAIYTQTGAGIGTIELEAAGVPVTSLTLLGDASGLAFSTSAITGGVVLTATPEKSSGNGPGGVMTNPTTSTGTTLSLNDLAIGLQGALGYAQSELLATSAPNTIVYEWFSADGLPPTENVTRFPAFEIVAPLPGQTGGGIGPGAVVTMQAGYRGVLLEGNENQTLTDGALGHALLVGNYGSDVIEAQGEGDTLVGAPGASTVFEGGLPAGAPGSGNGFDVTIIGGGNDTIATGNDAADVTTSGGRSLVYLGSTETSSVGNHLVLHGADTVVCGGTGGVRDDVTVSSAAGLGPNLLFGSPNSQLNITGGNTASIVVGAQSGVIFMQGGAANGSIVWGDGAQDVSYVGHEGSAIVVAGSGQTDVQGGSGPITIYGGTGQGVFTNEAAGSVIVAGAGATTIQATAGVSIFLSGSGAVSVAGSAGGDAFAGNSTGQDIFQCNAGNETMWGGLGSDTLLAGSGNDLLVSGGGTDVFGFTNGLAGGADEIVGFQAGRDLIKLDGYGAQAPNITYAYGDSYLNLADGTSIVLVGVPNLTASSIVTG